MKTVEVTETYKVPDLVSYVLRGVKVLDKHCPGWADKIDLKALALDDPNLCVVGQLAIREMLNGATNYSDGIGWLVEQKAIDVRQGEEWYGFDLPDGIADGIVEWVRKQPPNHPWWPIAVGRSNRERGVTEVQMRSVLWDYLTSIWVQLIKSRQEQTALLNKVRRQAKKATAPKVAKKAVAKKAVAKKTAKKTTRARR